MTRHYPDQGSASDLLCRVGNLFQPIRSTTQIRVVPRHQYGISALVSQTSFGGQTSGSVPKCRLFSRVSIWLVLWYFLITTVKSVPFLHKLSERICSGKFSQLVNRNTPGLASRWVVVAKEEGGQKNRVRVNWLGKYSSSLQPPTQPLKMKDSIFCFLRALISIQMGQVESLI